MELNPAFKIVVFCVALLAFTLNSLVIWITVTRDKRKRAIDSQLIGLIAFFDAFVSAFTIISQLIEWISTTPLTFVYGDWCLISSMLFDSSVIVALGLASQLSIVRYLTIVKMRALHLKEIQG
ncbi:hypothetical protein K502DRAFT_353582 [Neoconidiobolus thromboides FSU 785]|nr:hypothetical protein K502DRAFT_353582 [Neoconidiobolus thromboides FSU 785]